MGANFFPLWDDLNLYGGGGGGNNENNGVASPENVPFTLRYKDTCPYFSALFSNEKKS